MRAAVVLGGAPERRDPSPVLEAMQGRIERSVFDLQHVVGALLDGVRDGMAVGGAEHEGLQDEKIQRSLQQLAFERRAASRWHVDDPTPVDYLLNRPTERLDESARETDHACSNRRWSSDEETFRPFGG
jgi:hypothetical protein